jgi:hypothetical protein
LQVFAAFALVEMGFLVFSRVVSLKSVLGRMGLARISLLSAVGDGNAKALGHDDCTFVMAK